ncbi:2-C-methyl-D-erythritol 4-phosphate cytidylyltransferase [Carbonactinospora thermoautotrophica]|uniref:2-C-methyl-D-erythritol 4-phosphate cytidylyltransferase n=1 Tax=Carbonactinospora thermoautotrophica TaxID=1469144 RepID=A0A132MYR1_9ACTN|nr:2-C-methyl-D-erythritol 4-phosphate cytidylyltransferase [Carbonactinospora thermoautotrophica]
MPAVAAAPVTTAPAATAGLAVSHEPTSGLVPSAGDSQAVGQPLGGQPLLVHALRAVTAAELVSAVLVPAPSVAAVKAVLDAAGLDTARAWSAGETRAACLAAALRLLPSDADVVVVHSLAYPLIPPSLVDAVIRRVRDGADAAVPVGPVTDTIKRLDAGGAVVATVPRDELGVLQAPYAFRRDLAERLFGDPTGSSDEIERALRSGVKVAGVPGTASGSPVRAGADLACAEPSSGPAGTAPAAAVVLAGGRGSRFGADRNKAFLPVAGRLVAAWSLRAFAALPEIGRLVFVVRAEDRDLAERMLAEDLPGVPVDLVTGGATRHGSEYNALRHLAPAIRAGQVGCVLLHDAARPVVDPALVRRVLAAARRHGGALPGLPAERLVPVGPDDTVHGGVQPDLVRVQTPQAFQAVPLLAAYEAAERDGFDGSDTSACVERYAPGLRVQCVPGDPRNLKVTYAPDLLLAERFLAGQDTAAKATG